jgi:hypothetical protein
MLFDLMALVSLDNIPLFIMLALFGHLVHPMDFVHPSLNQSTSKLSKSLGDDLVGTMHLAKCYLQISASINLPLAG